MAEEIKPLNIFYEEPDPDRWVRFDRYPRRLIRRIVRGKSRAGGVMTVALNLMRGLDSIGVPYRFNDFSYIRKHPKDIACIIGKPQLLFDRKWVNPVILGAGVYSHPVECPDLFEKYPTVKRFLVPGEWMRKMCEPYYKNKVVSWPAGLDTDVWSPAIKAEPTIDFLIYDKIRWEHEKYRQELIDPLCEVLDQNGLTHRFIRYGIYTHPQLTEALSHARSVIFLCEHETQGLAYQQILATGTPILAWDRGGYWQDPTYYPEKVKYQPVSSVPYWDERCGIKFSGIAGFEDKLREFMAYGDKFDPRNYILENLTLEKCAEKYLKIYREVEKEIGS